MTAILVLEDGSLFRGRGIGAPGAAVGEVVFNTAMTGYQEILTDPSYARQIVALTYPHIGNTGVNDEDVESQRVWAAGLVVRDCPAAHASWRAEQSLPDYLAESGVVAIADVDTRRLTRLIRSKGAQAGCIEAGGDIDRQRALAAARAFPGLAGMDLARTVSRHEREEWRDGGWSLGKGYRTAQPSGEDAESTAANFGDGAEVRPPAVPLAASSVVSVESSAVLSVNAPPENGREAPHVVAYDFGVKRNILRLLADRGCRITVVPATTPAAEALALEPDGVFLSNGPGDPAPCEYAIVAIRQFLDRNVPLFGICLGHQLLALACGGRTVKLPFGHHGANHPVLDLASGSVLITSQNHGFAVDGELLPADVEVTHASLFDGTVQGIRSLSHPAFGFQGHPEASPGPHDCGHLFDRFVDMMRERSGFLFA